MPPSEYYPSFWPRVTDQWVWGAGNGPESNGWQGQAGSCVANACATMKEIHEYRQYGSANKYSIGYIFGNRSGPESNDSMDITDALNHLMSDGVPIYTELPEDAAGYGPVSRGGYDFDYVDNVTYVYPDTYMYFDWIDNNYSFIGARTLVNKNKGRDIYRSKISSYSQNIVGGFDITGKPINNQSASTVAAIQQSIIDNGCALIHTYIANNFDNLGGTGCTGVIPSTVDYNVLIDGVKSSHMMVILGWKLINGTTYWIVHNNWGNWWWGDQNRRGICYMPLYYSNIMGYYTVVDSPAQQNAPAPDSCAFYKDISEPQKYIDALASPNSQIGTLYYDKKLSFGPYANTWHGADVYSGAETYQDISIMTSGQTVQFRAKFTGVKPWLTEAGGADGWGWVYSDVYTKTRPSSFNWTHPPSSNGAIALTAAEWNAFTSNINSVRQYKSVGTYGFTTVTAGMSISAAVFNQAVAAINGVTTTSVPSVAVGSPLYASYFNQLVTDLNNVN